MNGTTTFSGFGGASGVNGGPGCTSSYEAETCTMTMSCEMAAGAYTNQFTFNLTFMGTSATGEATITLTDASGQVVSDCTYDIAMTRS